MQKQKTKQFQEPESERVELEILPEGRPAGSPVALKSVMENIPLLLTVELGRTIITLKDLRSLRQGQVLALDQIIGEPLGVFANGQRLGMGEVVAAGKDQYGVRITALADERSQSADEQP
jgi:flagellar motor switch protein FliN